MASRDFLKHTVSSSEPSNSAVGDEWYEPISNKLYKKVVVNGKFVQYKEVSLTNIISDTAPISPSPGTLWWDSSNGQLKIFYADGDSSQWVEANTVNGPAGPSGPIGPTGYTGSAGQVDLTTPQTMSNKTFSNSTFLGYTETQYSTNVSTSITLSLDNGTIQYLTLTGNTTISMPTVASGKSFVMYLKQDATGSRTVTWSIVKWAGGTVPTVTAAASRMDIFSFFSDGVNWYGAVIGQNYTP